ncbi:hypothetical protein DLM85_01470 [Hymenobacter edaphi]|uniref:Uncharacterized protein n=1 Tax=Hymenobacter edaphi TaxID=2211146 RepID=A0A328BR40_9BACT|nr:hypothetical protein DLM85_01470 [Hymenobacter edaphi]
MSDSNEFFMCFQFDKEPTQDDIDMCSEAAGEVSGDFVHMKSHNVSFISSNPVYCKQGHYPTLVYARAEY